jgi:50S ribosomal protein L16 3-hydroxylase
MTCSIGFRSPQRGGLAGELALRLADEHEDPVLYRDPSQPATGTPARVPADLQAFAAEGLRRLLAEGDLLGCTLGEVLTEPKPTVWFDEPAAPWTGGGLRLDRRTRMMYDDKHVFINGESFRAGGADARLMRQLADQREIDAQALARASEGARALLAEWVDSGWLLEVAHRA